MIWTRNERLIAGMWKFKCLLLHSVNELVLEVLNSDFRRLKDWPEQWQRFDISDGRCCCSRGNSSRLPGSWHLITIYLMRRKCRLPDFLKCTFPFFLKVSGRHPVWVSPIFVSFSFHLSSLLSAASPASEHPTTETISNECTSLPEPDIWLHLSYIIVIAIL